MRTLRRYAAFAVAGLAVLVANPEPGRAGPIMTVGVAFIDFDAPTTFTFEFVLPVPSIAGVTGYRFGFVGAMGDGTFDDVGASGALTLRLDADSDVDVDALGYEVSHDTPVAEGTTFMAAISITDFGPPSTFGFTFSRPISAVGPQAISLGLAGGLADGASDGTTLSLVDPNLSLGAYTVLTGTTEILAAAAGGASASPDPLAVYAPASGGDSGSCPTGSICDSEIMSLNFGASGGGDVFAAVMRGVRTDGRVDVDAAAGLADLGPDESTGIFNCALVGGCDAIRVIFSLQGSGGGDVYAFALRAELLDPLAVPTPAAAGLVALGLLGTFAARRRSA